MTGYSDRAANRFGNEREDDQMTMRVSRLTCDSPRMLMVLALLSVLALPAVPVVGQQDGKETAGDDQQAGSEFPEAWYYRHPITNERMTGGEELEGQPAPWLKAGRWYGKRQRLHELYGKVVVLNFWSTSCGECLLNMRDNSELAERFKSDDFQMIGVHHRRDGIERLDGILKQFNPPYPVAVDTLGSTFRAWRVKHLPTYAVIDKHGVVRAIGLKQERIDDVVEKLLDEAYDPTKVERRTAPEPESDPAGPSAQRVEIPADWLEGSKEKRAVYDELLARESPPAVESDTWINSEPLHLNALKGKVIMLDFWATWCAPCIGSIPRTNQLHEKYGDDGLVIIGVCNRRGVERMGAVAREHGIAYPVCADADGSIMASYHVNSYPDYHFIDRSGRLRVADCENGRIEDVIKLLLDEPAPGEQRTTPTRLNARGLAAPKSKSDEEDGGDQ